MAPSPFPIREDETWLRNLLKACDDALNDLRKTRKPEIESRILDLEHVREKVYRHLNGLTHHKPSPRSA